MARTSSKKGLSKDTSKKQKKMGKSSSGHQLCKRCSRRFGSKACAKRLCGSCCPLGGGAGHGAQCVAHLSLRRAAKRKQGAFLLVSSVNRLKREEERSGLGTRKKSKKPKLMSSKASKHLAKRLKTLSTAEECDDHGVDGDEVEVVSQESPDRDEDTWCDVGGAATLEAVVAVQAEEIARLRRELKHTRHAHERLKRKRVKVEQGLCIICEERGLNVLLVPCGHCYCRECVDALPSCPVCRSSIRKRHNFHPPAYVCDDAVLAMVPPSLPSAPKPTSPGAAALADEAEEFVLRRRSAANPHRILFV
jgi:hypothetical protein